MPYGYYEMVRVVAMIGFGILAYSAFEAQRTNVVFIYIGLIILFQPFAKIALGREMWNVVDVLVAIGLMIPLLIRKQ